MIDDKIKNKIKEFVAQGKSQTEVARLFNLSRQRINQIIKNEKKPITETTRDNILIRDKYTCQFGFKCLPHRKQPNLVVHHIDIDRNNNYQNNLITLCRECHVYFHKLNNEDKRKKYTCKKCLNKFNRDNFLYSKNICVNCNILEQTIKKNLWSPKYKLNECKICHSSDYKHTGNGLCSFCCQRQRFTKSINPEGYEKHKQQTYKWKLKNKEKAKAIEAKAQHKYYLKNKEKAKEYQKNYILTHKEKIREYWKRANNKKRLNKAKSLVDK